jgi:hypothetical protein
LADAWRSCNTATVYAVMERDRENTARRRPIGRSVNVVADPRPEETEAISICLENVW